MKSFRSVKRIGIASWDYDPPLGGLGRSMSWIAQALHQRGIEVSVMQGARSRLLYSMSVPLMLEQWYKSQKLDYVLLPTGPGGVFLHRRMQACRIAVLSYHTYWQQSHLVPGEGWKRIFIPLERRTLQSADHVFCYSPDTQAVLEREYGCSPSDVSLLPQISDIEAWFSNEEHRKEAGRCVCIARLDRRKGIDVLLQAWEKIQKMRPGAKLTIVGSGALEDRVDSLVQRFPLAVERLPALNRGELIALIRRADIVLCPSYLEGFGLVAMEAMAAGTALIASDTDGLRSLISHDHSGLLVAPGDAQAWADAVSLLLDDGDRRSRLAAAAQKHARKSFVMEAAIDALQERLEHV